MIAKIQNQMGGVNPNTPINVMKVAQHVRPSRFAMKNRLGEMVASPAT